MNSNSLLHSTRRSSWPPRCTRASGSSRSLPPSSRSSSSSAYWTSSSSTELTSFSRYRFGLRIRTFSAGSASYHGYVQLNKQEFFLLLCLMFPWDIGMYGTYPLFSKVTYIRYRVPTSYLYMVRSVFSIMLESKTCRYLFF